MKLLIKLLDTQNEIERGVLKEDIEIIKNAGSIKAEIPGKLNQERTMDLLKIYLFHEDYIDNWDVLIIEKVE